MKSLADLWCEVLQLDSIGDNENFILLGGDSLQMAELMVGIEARFGIRIPVEIIFEAPTIATLAKHIESDAATNSNNLVTIREAEQAPSIVCIHGGSGDILWGFAFAPHLSVEYGVYGCRWTNALAGDKETIETLAKHYCDAIEQSDMPKPIALVGYSSGGLIAFEMARQLRARGEDPAAVVILDIPTPAARNIWWPIVRHLREAFEGPVSELVPTLVRRAGNVLGRRYAPLRRVRERIWGREDGKLKPVKNIYTRAVQAYAPPPYDGDVMLVSATREAPIWRPKRDMGWADVVHGRLDIHEIDATHLTIVTEPVMRNWAQAVADYIGASADGSPPFPVE